jgi:hypothetical protein
MGHVGGEAQALGILDQKVIETRFVEGGNTAGE